MASFFDNSQAECFEAQLAINGDTVSYGGDDYTAIVRIKDEYYDDDFGGVVVRTTMEFRTADSPGEDVTVTHGSSTYRTEGVVRTKPHSERLAVSQLT